MTGWLRAAALAASLILAGCAEIPNVAEPTLAGSLPASFSGDLPCADCPGLRYRLNLFPDGAYFLRTTYLGRPKGESDDIGGWMSDGTSIVLKGTRQAPLTLRIKDRSTLGFLDGEGRDAPSTFNFELRRTATFEPLEPRLPMRGMYRLAANAGTFTECLTRQRWPVQRVAEHAALEAAYGKARRKPGEEVLVQVEGRVVAQPRPALVVERTLGAWPGETCGSRFATAPLENTYWKVTRLGDQPVSTRPGQRELHLVLQGTTGRVTGFSGCNRLAGEYQRKDGGLSFGKLASTRMACTAGNAMELEAAFASALQRVAAWKITGEHLELYDAGGGLLLRLEARAL